MRGSCKLAKSGSMTASPNADGSIQIPTRPHKRGTFNGLAWVKRLSSLLVGKGHHSPPSSAVAPLLSLWERADHRTVQSLSFLLVGKGRHRTVRSLPFSPCGKGQTTEQCSCSPSLLVGKGRHRTVRSLSFLLVGKGRHRTVQLLPFPPCGGKGSGDGGHHNGKSMLLRETSC